MAGAAGGSSSQYRHKTVRDTLPQKQPEGDTCVYTQERVEKVRRVEEGRYFTNVIVFQVEGGKFCP